MDEVYVYLVDLPSGVNEMVTPCGDGNYTVYLSAKLSSIGQQRAYEHALHHIQNHDFQKADVQQIESEAHGLIIPELQIKEDPRKKRYEEMRKKNARARKRIQKQLARKQKQVECLLETDMEYRRDHKIFEY